GDSTVRICPLMRKSGAAPVWRCTSDAPSWTPNRINWSKFMGDPGGPEATGDSLRARPYVIADHGCLDPVQALARGDIEGFAVGAAELDIGGILGHGDRRHNL